VAGRAASAAQAPTGARRGGRAASAEDRDSRDPERG
jgi:hypothetical protein